MTVFDVYGPYTVDYHRKVGGKSVEREHTREFWASPKVDWLCKRRGVYVFAMRSGPGLTPLYIGKATKTFKQEVFTDRNLHKLNSSMADWRKGNPVVFFLDRSGKGAAGRAIGELERFLINEAVLRNPALRNIQGFDKSPRFEIPGVTSTKPGARTKPQRAFLKVLGWR